MPRGQRSPGTDLLEERLLDATLDCVARWGIGKTTVDDIARAAGCSRATVYRAFPGKDALVTSAARREVGAFIAGLSDRLAAAGDLEGLLVIAICDTARFLESHPALQYLLAHEPEVVLPHIAFHRLDGIYRTAAAFSAPHLARFVADEAIAVTAEWVVRVVLSFLLAPSSGCDPANEDDARRLVRNFVLPGLRLPTPVRS